MYLNYQVVGISYHNSDVSLREKFSFTEEEIRKFISRISDVITIDDLLIVSTCIRAEIYFSSEKNVFSDFINLLCVEKNVSYVEAKKYFFHFTGLEAVNHLFRMSVGLDSKILGDLQIINQVKRSYQISADENKAGPFLHRLMHTIFFVNKRIVQETAFRDGVASTSYASVNIMKQFISNFTNPKILVLGLGEIGKDVVDNMEGIEAEVFLSNRTLEKAENVASKYNYKTVPYFQALQKLEQFDVIISNIPQPIIFESHFSNTSIKQKLLIDLSVPRSIDPKVENKSGILLYNIDQIEESTSSVLDQRKKAIVDVDRILNETIGEFLTWSKEMEISPTIKKLKLALEKIRQEEISKHFNKLNSKEMEVLDEATKNIIQKVIKFPVLQLKAACKRGESETLIDILNDLFNLENQQINTEEQ